MDDQTKQQVQQMIDQSLKQNFTTRRIGDTPTDAYQLTNKKYVDAQVAGLNKTVASVVSASSYTINTASIKGLSIYALSTAINPIDFSGSPKDQQPLVVRIKDNGSVQGITFSSKFVSYGSTIPSVTTAGKVHSIGFMYDINPSVFGCVSAQVQP